VREPLNPVGVDPVGVAVDTGFGIDVDIDVGATAAAAATEWFINATSLLNSSNALAYGYAQNRFQYTVRQRANFLPSQRRSCGAMLIFLTLAIGSSPCS